MCGYLVLFGPLVLVPVVLTSEGVSALGAGLALTALPAGFALAAVAAERILPSSLSERQRATLGAAICNDALGPVLTVTLSPTSLVPLLGLLGVGLGVFTPSNNTLIMGSIPRRASATGGGLLNMSRGLGTAVGVALVTLALHFGSRHPGIIPGDRLAISALLAAALLATISSRTHRGVRTRSSSTPCLPEAAHPSGPRSTPLPRGGVAPV